MIYLPAILIGRVARWSIRKVRPGGGSALPGLILSRIAPGLLAKTLRKFPQGLVAITGSAGKSTTTKMVVAIARAHGLEVFTNPSTANISQGFYSSIIERSNLLGRIPGDIAILEMDEGHAEEISRSVAPRIATLLNVLEDQLDRFIEPALVRDKLALVAVRATQSVVLNADDQNILLIADQNQLRNPVWFGLAKQVLNQSLHGLGTAPTYQSAIARPSVRAEVRSLNEKRVSLSIIDREAIFDLPNRGAHYAVDAVAAMLTAQQILGERFDLVLAEKTLQELPPVFARGETVLINGEEVEFILVQNPTSFQLNLDNLDEGLDRVMVAIGRDVHDPSWLWTVDVSKLRGVDVVSGFNFAEIALRLTYENISIGEVEEDLFEAFEKFMALERPTTGKRTVIFSADAMRRLRRHLGFTSPDLVKR